MDAFKTSKDPYCAGHLIAEGLAEKKWGEDRNLWDPTQVDQWAQDLGNAIKSREFKNANIAASEIASKILRSEIFLKPTRLSTKFAEHNKSPDEPVSFSKMEPTQEKSDSQEIKPKFISEPLPALEVPPYKPPAIAANTLVIDAQNLATNQNKHGNLFCIANEAAKLLAVNRWGENTKLWDQNLFIQWKGEIFQALDKRKKGFKEAVKVAGNILQETQALNIVPNLWQNYQAGQSLTTGSNIQLRSVEQQQMIATTFALSVEQMFKDKGFTPLSSEEVHAIHDGVMKELTGPTHQLDERIVKVARDYVKTHAPKEQWAEAIDVGLYQIEQQSQAFAEGRWNNTPLSEVHQLPREPQHHTKIIKDVTDEIIKGVLEEGVGGSVSSDKVTMGTSSNPELITIYEKPLPAKTSTESPATSVSASPDIVVTTSGSSSLSSSVSSSSSLGSIPLDSGSKLSIFDINTLPPSGAGPITEGSSMPYLPDYLKGPMSAPGVITPSAAEMIVMGSPGTRDTLPLSLAEMAAGLLSKQTSGLGLGILSAGYEAIGHSLNFISHWEDANTDQSKNSELSALFRMGGEAVIYKGLKIIPKVGSPLEAGLAVSQILTEFFPPEKDPHLFPSISKVGPETTPVEKMVIYNQMDKTAQAQALLDILRAPGRVVNWLSSQAGAVVDQLPSSLLSTHKPETISSDSSRGSPASFAASASALFSSSSSSLFSKSSLQQSSGSSSSSSLGFSSTS